MTFSTKRKLKRLSDCAYKATRLTHGAIWVLEKLMEKWDSW